MQIATTCVWCNCEVGVGSNKFFNSFYNTALQLAKQEQNLLLL